MLFTLAQSALKKAGKENLAKQFEKGQKGAMSIIKSWNTLNNLLVRMLVRMVAGNIGQVKVFVKQYWTSNIEVLRLLVLREPIGKTLDDIEREVDDALHICKKMSDNIKD